MNAKAKALLEDALRLFMTICNALNYAHQRGVIHRDLKPGNIRVDENGKPHVLDFGLAKLADGESADQASLQTLTGEFMGTLSYASPEQTQGDPRQIDIRSDVYSLGVILYEMLTDHLPYVIGGAMAEALRAIAVENPAPPSIWHKRDQAEGKVRSRSACKINKELETIILKALTKEKDRRYQTADRLKADISHYLEGEPIDAKRDSSWYVFQKTVRRHRAPVSVAAVIVLIVTVSIVYMVRQSEAAAELRGKWSDAKRMILNMIERHDPYKSKRVDETAIAVLDLYADELDRQPPTDPLEEAVIRCALGKAYREHGLYEKAGPQLLEALSIREASTEVSQAALAEIRHELAALYWKTGDYEAAEPLYERALEIREGLYEGGDREVAESLNHLAALRHRQGKYVDALDGYRAALEMRRALEGDRGERVGWSLNNVATCLRDMGRYEEAESAYRQSLAIHEEHLAEDHIHVAFVLTGLGRCLAKMGRFAEAEQVLLQALAIKRKQANPEHPTVATTLCYLAELRLDQGEPDEAEQLCREALEMQRRGLPGSDHPRIADSLLLLGRILDAQGDGEAAEAALREALEIRERIGHFLAADAAGVLGQNLVRQRRFEEAEPRLVQSHPNIVAFHGQDAPESAQSLERIVELYEAWEKPDRAEHYRGLLGETVGISTPKGSKDKAQGNALEPRAVNQSEP